MINRTLRPGRRAPRALAVVAAALAWAGVSHAAGPAVPPEQAEFFEKDVRPVLATSCQKCHGAKKQASGLRLDSREAILEGGVNGPAVVPGDPDGSLLIQAVRKTHEDIKMPPKGALHTHEIEALARWVSLGAPWPEDGPKSATAPEELADGASDHWAFRKVGPVEVPAVAGPGRVETPVDAFILARLGAAGLAPSPEADRRTLIRRATFDLTGLPPTPGEVEAFVNDARPDAFARLVDRLLDSPRYGERWARHWLDVARYADTKGYVFQEERRYPYAYTYRDYVIRAFNDDLPYDRFIREQIAADRLGDGPGSDPRSLAALGFLTLGRRFLNNQADIIDDRIDVVSRGLMGLTVACARCHDHKFDPIPTDDYYSLYGVFASSVEPADPPEVPAAVPGPLRAEFLKAVGGKQKAVDEFVAARTKEIEADLYGRAGAYLKAAFALNFEGRSAKLDEQAKAAGVTPGRLRGVAFRWKARLDATRSRPDAVFGPWHAFAALPPGEFSRKAPGLAQSMPNDDPQATNPVLAQRFADAPPSSMADVAARYADVLTEVHSRWAEAVKADPKAAALKDPAWEAIRQAGFGEGGPFSVTPETLPRLLDRAERNKLNELNKALAQVKATHPGSPPRAMVLNDAPRPVEPRVFLRGNPGRPGKAVPRRFLAVLSGPGRTPFKDGSGRRELAEAIASPDNPLTARVMVNRVWLHHFGRGLVSSPGDFGRRSDPPTHPELLDWLAGEFVRHGWSVKHLHRTIMLSRAYRQSSAPREDGLAKDSENRLYWRYNRRRLEFEPLRDAILAASGALDPTMGGRPVSILEAPFPPRRTIYGFIDRQNLEGVYRTFDFASPDTTSARRFVTTVPQQALFLMNSPFVIDQARRLARLPDLAQGEAEERIVRYYARLFGRAPDAGELAAGLRFVRGRDRGVEGTPPASEGASAWESYAQALLMTNEFAFVD